MVGGISLIWAIPIYTPQTVAEIFSDLLATRSAPIINGYVGYWG